MATISFKERSPRVEGGVTGTSRKNKRRSKAYTFDEAKVIGCSAGQASLCPAGVPQLVWNVKHLTIFYNDLNKLYIKLHHDTQGEWCTCTKMKITATKEVLWYDDDNDEGISLPAIVYAQKSFDAMSTMLASVHAALEKDPEARGHLKTEINESISEIYTMIFRLYGHLIGHHFDLLTVFELDAKTSERDSQASIDVPKDSLVAAVVARLHHITLFSLINKSVSEKDLHGMRALIDVVTGGTVKITEDRDKPSLSTTMSSLSRVMSNRNGFSTDRKRRSLSNDGTPTKMPSFDSVSLDSMCYKMYGRHLSSYDGIPSPIVECIRYMRENNGALKEGLFRINGSKVSIKKIQTAYDDGEDVVILGELEDDQILKDTEFLASPATVAGVIKNFIGQLPEPPLAFSLFDSWVEAAMGADGKATNEEFCAKASVVLGKLKAYCTVSYDTIVHLFDFIKDLCANSEVTKMQPVTVGIALGPSLLKEDLSDVEPTDAAMRLLKSSETVSQVIKLLIDNFEPLMGSRAAEIIKEIADRQRAQKRMSNVSASSEPAISASAAKARQEESASQVDVGLSPNSGAADTVDMEI